MFAFTLTIHSYSMLFLFVLSSVFSIQSAELRCRLLVTSTLIHIFFCRGHPGAAWNRSIQIQRSVCAACGEDVQLVEG